MSDVRYLTGNEPGIKQILAVGAPRFKGRNLSWIAAERVQLGNTYWDEGTRFAYCLVALDGSYRAAPIPAMNPPQFGGPRNQQQPQAMCAGVALVEHYQGRRESVCIYVHPEDAPRLLPPVGTVTRQEHIVLFMTRAYVNTYGGLSDYRFREAVAQTEITRAEWDAAKAALIARKLLTKAGAITVAGRNAIANLKSPVRGPGGKSLNP